MIEEINTLTPPAVGTSLERTFRLERKSIKTEEGRPLVKTSVNYDVVGT